MSRTNTEPFHQIVRNDTLGLRTAFFYERGARPATTPILVGSYVVLRKPLPDTPMTQYMIMDGSNVAAIQISYPTPEDCHTAVTQFREKNKVAHLHLAAGTKKPRKYAWSIKKNRRQEAA